ncbi:MAG: YceI family protein [Phycisphaerales bacterium]
MLTLASSLLLSATALLAPAPQTSTPPATPPARPAAPAATAPATPPASPQPTAPVPGERLTFDFKDPKGVNGFVFMLDSILEPIVGSGTGLSGTVEFDPTNPLSATGMIKAEAKGLKTTNERMASVLQGADWLDVATYPSIDVKLVKIASAEAVAENTVQTQANVEVTIKGKTVPMIVPVKATFLPGRLGDRVMGAKGDLLVLRSQFAVKRSVFGIKPDQGTDIVADDIQIMVAVVGVRKTG